MSKEKKSTGEKIQSRARIWCFTINNPDEKDESHLSQEKFLIGIKSIIWQLEEGEQKTPHIQGVVQLKNQMTFSTIKKKLPEGAHVEVCKNFNASKNYCQKEEGRLKGPYIYPSPIKWTDKEIGTYINEYLQFGDEELELNIPENAFIMPDGWVEPP